MYARRVSSSPSCGGVCDIVLTVTWEQSGSDQLIDQCAQCFHLSRRQLDILAIALQLHRTTDGLKAFQQPSRQIRVLLEGDDRRPQRRFDRVVLSQQEAPRREGVTDAAAKSFRAEGAVDVQGPAAIGTGELGQLLGSWTGVGAHLRPLAV